MAQPKTSTFQQKMAVKFVQLLSGSPTGAPPWLEVVAEGDTAGLFLPSDAPWLVHNDMATLVGGIRALLLQALHPGSLAGVAQHSRYKEDALGRLAGTIRWLTVTTYGSTAAVAGEASRVNRLHDRVNGDYTSGSGERLAYSARQTDLLRWVHIAFCDAFLTSHQMFSREEIPGGADNYVAQWARSVELLGLDPATLPTTADAMHAEIQQLIADGVLVSTDQTRDVVKFIRRPPLKPATRLAYWFLFQGAVQTLPLNIRQMLGVRALLPKSIIVPLVGSGLRGIRVLIGDRSPIVEAALARLRRVTGEAHLNA
ncbi:MAG: hypothetical protein RL196_1565 [Actinomycetota bacterium]|jgi:uncharacterized protein (DUF2236 family)